MYGGFFTLELAYLNLSLQFEGFILKRQTFISSQITGKTAAKKTNRKRMFLRKKNGLKFF